MENHRGSLAIRVARQPPTKILNLFKFFFYKNLAWNSHNDFQNLHDFDTMSINRI